MGIDQQNFNSGPKIYISSFSRWNQFSIDVFRGDTEPALLGRVRFNDQLQSTSQEIWRKGWPCYWIIDSNQSAFNEYALGDCEACIWNQIIVQVVTILPPNSQALDESFGYSECKIVNYGSGSQVVDGIERLKYSFDRTLCRIDLKPHVTKSILHRNCSEMRN